MKNLFSNEIVQKGKQTELYLVKGFSFFFMYLVHIFEEVSSPSVHDTWIGNIVEFCGSPLAAPIFMMCMGIGMIYSSKSDPKSLFKRGVNLIISGYIFNIIRYTAPILLGLSLGLDLSNSPLTWFEQLIAFDILHFAGFAHIFIAVLKYFKIDYKYYGILALVFAFVSPTMYGFSTGNDVLDLVLAPLFSTAEIMWFPLFPWLTYVLFGMYFGDLLSRTVDKARFYKTASLMVTPVFILGLVLLCWNQEFWTQEFFNKIIIDEYYQHGTGLSLFIMGIDVYFISLVYFIGDKIPSIVSDKLAYFGRYINEGYYAQYTIIGWTAVFTSFVGFNFIQTVIMSILTGVVSYLLIGKMVEVKARKKAKISMQKACA